MLIECILGQASHSCQCFLLGQFFELEKFLPLLNLVLHDSLQQKKRKMLLIAVIIDPVLAIFIQILSLN